MIWSISWEASLIRCFVFILRSNTGEGPKIECIYLLLYNVQDYPQRIKLYNGDLKFFNSDNIQTSI